MQMNKADHGFELRIFDEIGGHGTYSDQVMNSLEGLNGDLVVRINSPGGDVFEGLAIMNALRRHPGRVTAVVEGLAASAASFIAVGGADRVVMRPHAEMMIHEAWGMAMGPSEDMKAMALQLDRTSGNLARIYAEKAGGSPGLWRDRMQAETWFSADEAVNFGLADEVQDAREDRIVEVGAFALARRFNYAGRENAPAPKQKGGGALPFMKEVAQRLGLVEADETKVLAALDETLTASKDPAEEPGVVEAPEVGELEKESDGEPVEAQDVAEEASAERAPAVDDAEDAEETPVDDADGEEPEESEDSEDEPEAQGADNVVHLDRAVYEDLLSRAQRGDKADEESAHERAVALVSTEGIKAGRILGWQREQWIKDAEKDYEATRKALMSLASGRVPLEELGHAGIPKAKGENEKRAEMNTRANKAGFAQPPTV